MSIPTLFLNSCLKNSFLFSVSCKVYESSKLKILMGNLTRYDSSRKVEGLYQVKVAIRYCNDGIFSFTYLKIDIIITVRLILLTKSSCTNLRIPSFPHFIHTQRPTIGFK